MPKILISRFAALSAVVLMDATTVLLAATPAPPVAVTEPSLKGYGIKGVAGETLPAMLDRCAQAARGSAPLAPDETPALLRARCEQLKRSFKTQPGNTARPRR